MHSEEAVQGQARVSSHSASGRVSFHTNQAVEEEKQLIDREVERGMVYLMGEASGEGLRVSLFLVGSLAANCWKKSGM